MARLTLETINIREVSYASLKHSNHKTNSEKIHKGNLVQKRLMHKGKYRQIALKKHFWVLKWQMVCAMIFQSG
jgi:hypothetical protein